MPWVRQNWRLREGGLAEVRRIERTRVMLLANMEYVSLRLMRRFVIRGRVLEALSAVVPLLPDQPRRGLAGADC